MAKPTQTKFCRRTSLAAMALAGLLSLAAAPTGAVDLERQVSFSIPSQPLSSALMLFAEQAKIQVLTASNDLSAYRTGGAQGQLSVRNALAAILEGTDLRYEEVGERTVTISRGSTSDTAATSATSHKRDERMQLVEAEGADSSARLGEQQTTQGEKASAANNDVQEIVVTAQKREERLQDVPISISVLSGNDLDRSTFTGVMDAIRAVPGVALFRGGYVGGAGTEIKIRGVGAAGGLHAGSSPIGYYLDSIPFGLVKTALIPDQSAYDLERVEVLRGPQGTLYGASSANGLVRVLTKDANLKKHEFKARTMLSSTDGAGSANYRGDVAVNVPIIEGKLAVRGVAGYENFSGWIANATEDDINDEQHRSYRVKISAQPMDSLNIGLSSWRTRNDYGTSSLSDDDRRTNITQAEPQTSDMDIHSLKIAYDSSWFSLVSASSYLDYSGDSVIDAFDVGLPGISSRYALSSEVFSQEIVLTSTPDSAWRWTAGVFYRDAEDGLIIDAPAFLPFAVDWINQSESYALFGELGRKFWNDKLGWTLGLRYFHDDVSTEGNNFLTSATATHFASGSFTSTTPRAVLTWYPNADVTVYGSYSEGFRSGFPPSIDVLLAAPDFPVVGPDKLKNYEIGAKSDLWAGRVSVETAIYYIDWKDVQQALAVPWNGLLITAQVNGESASGIGADFSVTTRPRRGVELGLTASWNDLAIDEDVRLPTGAVLFNKGDRPVGSPEYTFGASMQYGFPLGAGGYQGTLSASANYTSELQTRQAANVAARVFDGDPLLIGQAQFAIESPHHWRTSLFVDNFTNDYGAITRGNLLRGAPRLRPRTVGIQLDYRF